MYDKWQESLALGNSLVATCVDVAKKNNNNKTWSSSAAFLLFFHKSQLDSNNFSAIIHNSTPLLYFLVSVH